MLFSPLAGCSGEAAGSPADAGHTNSPSEQEWDGQACRVNEPGKLRMWSTARTPRQRSHFEPPGQNPEFNLLLSIHRGEEVKGRVLTIYLIFFLCAIIQSKIPHYI